MFNQLKSSYKVRNFAAVENLYFDEEGDINKISISGAHWINQFKIAIAKVDNKWKKIEAYPWILPSSSWSYDDRKKEWEYSIVKSEIKKVHQSQLFGLQLYKKIEIEHLQDNTFLVSEACELKRKSFISFRVEKYELGDCGYELIFDGNFQILDVRKKLIVKKNLASKQ